MKWRSVWTGMLVAGVLMGGGCKNNNLFGDLHKEGSGDAASLVSDGESALASGNYAAAQGYFERALAQEPGNSKALYGAAAAAMGAAGFNIGQLIANLTQGNSGASAPSLSGVIRQGVYGAPGAIYTDNPNSLLYGLDPGALDDALEFVIPKLETVHLGLGDGTIDPHEPSLVINLGLARLLKGVTGPLRINLIDIRESLGNYDVVLTTPSLSGNCVVVENSVYQVAWGFLNLKEAATALNLVSGSTLDDIKEDVDRLYNDYRIKISPDCGDPGPRPENGPTTPGQRL